MIFRINGDTPQRIPGMNVSANYFDELAIVVLRHQ